MKKLFIIIAFFVGILLVIQVRSFKKITSLVERNKPQNIFAELRFFQVANEQLKSRLAEDKATLDQIKQKLSSSDVIENEINTLKLLSGEIPVSGEGIEIVFNTNLKAFWVSDLIAQLVGAEAEAVAINDIRLIDRTAGFRNVADGFVMRREFLRAPLKITAIGPRQALKQAVSQAGGIIERIEDAQPSLKIALSLKDKIVMPALAY